jgi:hypothetical protein
MSLVQNRRPLASVAPTTVFFTDTIRSIGTWDESFCFEARFCSKSDAFSSLVLAEELLIAAGGTVATILETNITGTCHIFYF